MTDLQIANMLADYHKECELAETLREKADVQLKHARLIREALRQPLVRGMLHPDIEKLLRYTIKQWSSLNEQREPDHEDLINHWLNGDLKEWIKSNCI